MYFLYADESGDTGRIGSPTRYFCLSGFIVHELRWRETLDAIVGFRKSLRDEYGLKLRDEIHAAHYINSPGDLKRIPKSIRLKILKEVIDFQSNLSDICIINIIIDKHAQPAEVDIFEIAWGTLVQRFHNTLSRKNFPGPQNADDRGMFIVDRTDEVKLRALTRRMRYFNHVPRRYGGGSTNIPITTMVEDAAHRDSLHSYFVQLADVNAYFLYQKFTPCKYVKKQGGRNYFSRLGNALCLVASTKDKEGIVRL